MLEATPHPADGLFYAGHALNAVDVDWYSITALAGITYVLQTTGRNDTYMELFNSTGVQIASNDDDGDGMNSQITWTCITSGKYFFSVQGFAFWTDGPYGTSVRSY